MKYSLRNLLKFSIRDLLWLTVVVALAVAWSLDRSRLLEKASALDARNKFEKSLADTEVALANAQATAAKARADFEAEVAKAQVATSAAIEFRQSADRSEGPVQGYKLLGPPPQFPKP
jgi:hypothetical protein